MKSTKGIVRSAYNDGATRRSTGFKMTHQMYQDTFGKAHFKDVMRIHMEKGVQVGSVKMHGKPVKVYKTKDYPAWRDLQDLEKNQQESSKEL